MPIFEYNGTINPGAAQTWWTTGSGWYTVNNKPQLDAYPLNPGSELIYKDFGCSMNDDGTLTYYVTVVNVGSYVVNYKMRVWVP
jgi:hypothetical protein